MSLYGNTRSFGAVAPARLPTFVEYIESSGTQYIDTGYIANANTMLEVDAAIDSSSIDYATVIGAGPADYSSELFIRAKKNNTSCIYAAWTNSRYKDVLSSYSDFGAHLIFTVNASYATVIRPTAAAATATFSGSAANYPQFSLFLFGFNLAGTLSQPCVMKLFGVRIWESNQLVKHFVPAIDPNGIAGVYEVLSATMYYNVGTGDFTVPASS